MLDLCTLLTLWNRYKREKKTITFLILHPLSHTRTTTSSFPNQQNETHRHIRHPWIRRPLHGCSPNRQFHQFYQHRHCSYSIHCHQCVAFSSPAVRPEDLPDSHRQPLDSHNTGRQELRYRTMARQTCVH